MRSTSRLSDVVKRHIVLGPVLLVVACATAPAPPPVEAKSNQTARMGIAGPPFDASQLHEAISAGMKWTYEIHQAGKPTIRKVTVVEATSASEMTIVETSYNQAGEVIGKPARSTTSWTDLELHGTFSAAHTTIEEVEIDIPLGVLEGWRYTVAVPDAGPNRVQVFSFAKTMPGPPVLFEQTDDGKVVFRMVRVE